MEDIYLEIFNKINKFRSQSGGQRWNLICIDICDLYILLIKEQKDLLYTYDELWDFLFHSYTVESSQYIKYLTVCKNNKVNKNFFYNVVYKAIEDPPAEWWNVISSINL
jgi:hypothetical protein